MTSSIGLRTWRAARCAPTERRAASSFVSISVFSASMRERKAAESLIRARRAPTFCDRTEARVM